MEQLIKVRRKPAEISIKDTNAGFSVAKRKERCSGSEIIMISDHCATLPKVPLSSESNYTIEVGKKQLKKAWFVHLVDKKKRTAIAQSPTAILSFHISFRPNNYLNSPFFFFPPSSGSSLEIFPVISSSNRRRACLCSSFIRSGT